MLKYNKVTSIRRSGHGKKADGKTKKNRTEILNCKITQSEN